MKRKRNLTKAELDAQANWEKLNAKWDSLPKFARQEHAPPANRPEVDLGYRKVQHHKSRGGMGSAGKVEPQKYTGTKMIGVAVMHKSSMVPVFSQEEAIDIANMRRST